MSYFRSILWLVDKVYFISLAPVSIQDSPWKTHSALRYVHCRQNGWLLQSAQVSFPPLSRGAVDGRRTGTIQLMLALVSLSQLLWVVQTGFHIPTFNLYIYIYIYIYIY